MIKKGSKWTGNEGKIFCVIETVEIDGKKWVYYRSEDAGREFSCFEEGFLARFSPYTNERR
jgi:hypothetical protein